MGVSSPNCWFCNFLHCIFVWFPFGRWSVFICRWNSWPKFFFLISYPLRVSWRRNLTMQQPFGVCVCVFLFCDRLLSVLSSLLFAFYKQCLKYTSCLETLATLLSLSVKISVWRRKTVILFHGVVFDSRQIGAFACVPLAPVCCHTLIWLLNVRCEGGSCVHGIVVPPPGLG